MEAINNLNSGMSSDLAKQYYKANTYLQSLNFRPLTELGESNGSLVNIKGNECKISFPNLQPVYKLILTKGTIENSVHPIAAFSINNTSSPTQIIFTNNTTGLEIYNYIIANFPECYQNTTPGVKTFSIAYEDNYVVIFQQPIYKDCGPIGNSIDPFISILYQGATDGTLPLLQFENSNNTPPSVIQDNVNPYIKGALAKDIITIGSTFILNDIYLLTAINDLSYTQKDDFNDTFSKPGQVWELNIDDITKQHTLTLIYSNNLDFTKYHPIPPSAITGRYESKEIQRIYWSDNFNKIRTLNVKLPQLMALNPSLLNVMPKVEFTQGTLKSIGIGALDAGCYQFGYRLSKVLGSVTNFSELSNPVYLTVNVESDPFELYEGALGAANKSITWHLENLDLRFDQIEPVIVYRNNATSVPIITSMGLRPLLEDMDITYFNIADTGNTTLTLDEFLLFNGTFTHARTCDTKDNRLFWGNVRFPKKDLSTFDTRAFRANDLGEIRTTNSNINISRGTTPAIVSANFAETEDMINEYYDATGAYSPNACYLRPSTSSTTKELGGEGINISYTFGTKSIQTDNDFSISSSNYDIAHGSPFRTNNTDSSIITLSGQYQYPQNNKYFSMKQPEKTSLLKGFQHEEIYRFGIQFKDNEGNPYFTKWIGDIKMPSYGDYNHHSDSGINDFRLTYTTTYNIQYTQILYIEFKVNISSIKDIIGSYEIVRVKRESGDRTIWGTGMINPFAHGNSSGPYTGSSGMLPNSWNTSLGAYSTPGVPGLPRLERYYSPYPDQYTVETLNTYTDDGSSPIGMFKMFDCWDFDIGLRPVYAAGDQIRIREQLKCINYNRGDAGYRKYFTNSGSKGIDKNGNAVPPDNARINDGTYGENPNAFLAASNNDSGPIEPFFIMKMLSNNEYCKYTDFLAPSLSYDYNVIKAQYVQPNNSISWSTSPGSPPYSLRNYGEDVFLNTPYIPSGSPPSTTNQADRPSYGKQTLFVHLDRVLATTTQYNCTPNNLEFKKVLALYYKPNPNLYGGATYSSRSSNEYIPCSELISNKNSLNPILTIPTFGGDIFSVIYDMQKTEKGAVGSEYKVYTYASSSPHIFTGFDNRYAKFSTSFFFPSTVMYNSEVRLGDHVNRSLSIDGGYGEDSYQYNTYNNAENDIVTYFPKPLNFQSADEWRARVYFSEIKFDNETSDSWSQYLTGSFHDCEGTYGGINALITLNNEMYYLQDRAVGMLLINPVATSDTSVGPVLIGTGKTIQKHNNISIDVGTYHQWSVYRSQSAISFVDARHKKIYLFNGESKPTPISDIKGQRNFVIKRLHNELLKFDNPVIGKGILVTYDYYHNEFLYTFNNIKQLGIDPITYDDVNNENLTLAYSEIADSFTGMYSFTPNLYINSNKYLISTIITNSDNKLWFHNYGTYGNFYNVPYKCNLKLLVNDNPIVTKVFDNITLSTESIKDNVEWNDDFNLYPGSATNPSYPDDINNQTDTFNKVRCYNDWQNTDWTTLTLAPPNNTLTRKERNFNLQVPRNKFNYDIIAPSVSSLFNPTYLNKLTFGERIRDKYLIIDLEYPNTTGNRFIVNNIKTVYRVSDR